MTEWEVLSEGLDTLFRREPMTPEKYMNLYTTVYDYCNTQMTVSSLQNSSDNNRADNVHDGLLEFYNKLSDYIGDVTMSIYKKGAELRGEDLLKYFITEWEDFRWKSLRSRELSAAAMFGITTLLLLVAMASYASSKTTVGLHFIVRCPKHANFTVKLWEWDRFSPDDFLAEKNGTIGTHYENTDIVDIYTKLDGDEFSSFWYTLYITVSHNCGSFSTEKLWLYPVCMPWESCDRYYEFKLDKLHGKYSMYSYPESWYYNLVEEVRQEWKPQLEDERKRRNLPKYSFEKLRELLDDRLGRKKDRFGGDREVDDEDERKKKLYEMEENMRDVPTYNRRRLDDDDDIDWF